MPAAPAVPRKPLNEYRMEFQKVAVFYRASMPIGQAFCRDFGVQGKSAASKRRYQAVSIVDRGLRTLRPYIGARVGGVGFILRRFDGCLGDTCCLSVAGRWLGQIFALGLRPRLDRIRGANARHHGLQNFPRRIEANRCPRARLTFVGRPVRWQWALALLELRLGQFGPRIWRYLRRGPPRIQCRAACLSDIGILRPRRIAYGRFRRGQIGARRNDDRRSRPVVDRILGLCRTACRRSRASN